MNETEKNIRSEFILELISRHGVERTSLLPVLQEFQKKFGYVDGHSQQEIAFAMNIHPVEVNSIISFYSFLYDSPRGRNTVRICKNIVCDFHGSSEIADAVRKEFKLNSGNTSGDGKITLEITNCFGLCDKSPSMIVNENVYEKIDKESALKILRGLR